MQSVKTFIQDKFIFDKWTALSFYLLAIYSCEGLFYFYSEGLSVVSIVIVLVMALLVLIKSVYSSYIDNVELVIVYCLTALGIIYSTASQLPYMLDSIYFISHDVAAKNIANLAKIATISQIVSDTTALNVDITQNYNVLHSNLLMVQNIQVGDKDVFLQMQNQINQFDNAASQMYADIISMKAYLRENNSFIYGMVNGELNSLSLSFNKMTLVNKYGITFMNNWGVLTLLLVMEVVFTLLAFYILVKDKIAFKK